MIAPRAVLLSRSTGVTTQGKWTVLIEDTVVIWLLKSVELAECVVIATPDAIFKMWHDVGLDKVPLTFVWTVTLSCGAPMIEDRSWRICVVLTHLMITVAVHWCNQGRARHLDGQTLCNLKRACKVNGQVPMTTTRSLYSCHTSCDRIQHQ